MCVCWDTHAAPSGKHLHQSWKAGGGNGNHTEVRRTMYRFSRQIYRELAPRVIEDPRDTTDCANKQKVLDSCEAAIRRLAYDRRYFARPARSLFNEVRVYFSMGDQLRVWTVIERNITLALNFLEQMPEELGLGDEHRECQAHT